MDEKITQSQNEADMLFSDLRQMIEAELGEKNLDSNLKHIFEPLTDGLGLQSPRSRKEMMFGSEGEDLSLDQKIEDPLEKETHPPFIPPASRPMKPSLKQSLEKPPQLQDALSTSKALDFKLDSQTKQLPPPIPTVSFFRRFLSGFMDQAFVLTIWVVALAISLRMLTGSFVGLASGDLSVLGHPHFVEFAVIEYAALWAAYLAVCIGLMDMTFGMWIWGIRVGYGEEGSNVWMKKALRIVFSFVFHALIAPLVLLVFLGKKGRNLLDVISGTNLYRVP